MRGVGRQALPQPAGTIAQAFGDSECALTTAGSLTTAALQVLTAVLSNCLLLPANWAGADEGIKG